MKNRKMDFRDESDNWGKLQGTKVSKTLLKSIPLFWIGKDKGGDRTLIDFGKQKIEQFIQTYTCSLSTENNKF